MLWGTVESFSRGVSMFVGCQNFLVPVDIFSLVEFLKNIKQLLCIYTFVGM